MLGPTIFIVDDEASVREAMRALLHEEGWLVKVYSSGEAFLEGYRPGRGGCLVVDAGMPCMSGLELLERLKIEGGEPPAIMITGHADIRLAVRAMKAGAMAFLEKPVQYDELVGNIERALELSRNSSALSSLREAAARRIAALTLRERQVVKMVVEGYGASGSGTSSCGRESRRSARRRSFANSRGGSGRCLARVFQLCVERPLADFGTSARDVAQLDPQGCRERAASAVVYPRYR